jgi:hypothetical protein
MFPVALLSVMLAGIGSFRASACQEDDARLDAKLSARLAQMERGPAVIRALELERRDSARSWQAWCDKANLAGRGNYHFQTDSHDALLRSELALSSNPADRGAALLRQWERIWHLDSIARERYDAGRIGIRDMLGIRWHRLNAEIAIAKARQDGWLSREALAMPIHDAERLVDKSFAKAKHDLMLGDVQSLWIQQRDLAKTRCARQINESMAGRSTIWRYQEASMNVLQAETALAQQPEEHVGAAEDHWARTALMQGVIKERFDAGRVTHSDYALARYYLTDATDRWRRARNVHGTAAPLAMPTIAFGLAGDDFSFGWWISPENIQTVARAKAELATGDEHELLRQRRDLAREVFEGSLPEFRMGRGWFYSLLEKSSAWLEAELDLVTSNADRRAAWERHWRRVASIEHTLRKRWAAERVAEVDLLAVKVFRLDAEIVLASLAP